MPFLGEVRIFAGQNPPQGWARCDGQILSIGQNTALFSILGTTYGGNGQTTFALPDLRGRVPIKPGQGPGLSNRDQGEVGGTATHTLSVSEMAFHQHLFRAGSANGSSDDPTGNAVARTPAAVPEFAANADSDLSAGAVAATGGGGPHNNLQPYLALNYIIALSGTFPPR